MKSKPTKDYEVWKKAKAKAIELMRPGTLTYNQVIDAMSSAGYTPLYHPARPTMARWAEDHGLALKRKYIWTDARKEEAIRMMDSGMSAKEVQSALRKKYGHPPALTKINDWHAAKRGSDPWKIADIMIRTRNGADREATLTRVHGRLTKWGYGHLCSRISMESGLDLWEIGLFLEKHECHQVAIDTALLAVYTGSAGFLATARECMKKKRKKARREDAIVMHSEAEFFSGVAA